MSDIRAHAMWPELRALYAQRLQARERLLEAWPEGATPDDLAGKDREAFDLAMLDDINATKAYDLLLAKIQDDVAGRKYE
jgi:hypothetical protein